VTDAAAVEAAAARFADAWPGALTAFSPYTRLAPPILCRSPADEQREGLEGSFAMIRVRDQRIVIGLEQIVALALGDHAHAILAHEVGHYVHAPGSLREHVRLHDRLRRTLPTELACHAGLVGNLYTDLLLNDRLQRARTADIAAVYVALRRPEASTLWAVYMRTYERLWSLSADTLTAPVDPAIEADAELMARIVRTFRDRWLDGAPSFALLIAPYLAQLPTDRLGLAPWMDTAGTSVGELVPDGLTDDDFDPAAIKHPAVDPALGDDADAEAEAEAEPTTPKRYQPGRATGGDGRPDRRKVARGPAEWLDLMRAVGVRREPRELVGRYYRELAMPHVLPFPVQRLARAGDPLPEGLDPWEAGGALEAIDWFETLAQSPGGHPRRDDGAARLRRHRGAASPSGARPTSTSASTARLDGQPGQAAGVPGGRGRRLDAQRAARRRPGDGVPVGGVARAGAVHRVGRVHPRRARAARRAHRLPRHGVLVRAARAWSRPSSRRRRRRGRCTC
jgi:hypothetical protein